MLQLPPPVKHKKKKEKKKKKEEKRQSAWRNPASFHLLFCLKLSVLQAKINSLHLHFEVKLSC